MPYQIALETTPECENELLKKGFEKKEVWIKSFDSKSKNREVACSEGDLDFRAMNNPPVMFATTSVWLLEFPPMNPSMPAAGNGPLASLGANPLKSIPGQ